jgi:hypothetical protein
MKDNIRVMKFSGTSLGACFQEYEPVSASSERLLSGRHQARCINVEFGKLHPPKNISSLLLCIGLPQSVFRS